MSENTKVEFRHGLHFLDVPVTSGALDINVGDNVNYGADGFGKAGGDVKDEKFAGVAMDALHVSASDNTAAGTHTVRVLPANAKNIVRRPITATRATAMPGTKVYVKGVKEVSAAATTNSVECGVIAAFVSETECDIAI